jgi:hypothetical protein
MPNAAAFRIILSSSALAASTLLLRRGRAKEMTGFAEKQAAEPRLFGLLRTDREALTRRL